VTLTLRPYAGPADLPRLDAVRAAARTTDGDRWWPGPAPDDAAEEGLDARGDRCVVAEVDGAVVGFGWAQWWTEVTGARVCLFTGCVAPRQRRRGVGSALLRRQEQLAVRDAHGPLVAAANAGEDQPDVRALLVFAGYAVAFTVVDMACVPARCDATVPEGFTIRGVVDADHPRIHRAIEECFVDAASGHVPRTFAEYLADVQDVDLWWSAWHGDELAGIVVNERQSDGGVLTPWVAVTPPFRRRGVAGALLRAGLSTLADLGVPRATLATVRGNRYGSEALYEQLGYRVTATQPRYRKTLRAARVGDNRP
jgi:mycothiol synthase